LHRSIIMKFKSWFCSDSKLIYVKEIIEKMNTLIYTFHFRLHNSMAHLSNVLELSQSFEIQWNLLFWKYIINQFYFGTNTNSMNLRIHKLVIFNQTTKKVLSQYVTVEHVLPPKNAMSPMGFDTRTSRFVSHCSTNWAKGDLH
jgi:hypothetical protein